MQPCTLLDTTSPVQHYLESFVGERGRSERRLTKGVVSPPYNSGRSYETFPHRKCPIWEELKSFMIRRVWTNPSELSEKQTPTKNTTQPRAALPAMLVSPHYARLLCYIFRCTLWLVKRPYRFPRLTRVCDTLTEFVLRNGDVLTEESFEWRSQTRNNCWKV